MGYKWFDPNIVLPDTRPHLKATEISQLHTVRRFVEVELADGRKVNAEFRRYLWGEAGGAFTGFTDTFEVSDRGDFGVWCHKWYGFGKTSYTTLDNNQEFQVVSWRYRKAEVKA